MNSLAVVFLLLLDQAPPTSHLQHGDISRPRVGVMSEQVIRQRLIAYGLDITTLELQGKVYVANVRVDGRAEILQIDPQNGRTLQNRRSVRLRPTSKALKRAIKPDPRRVPWNQRTIHFDQIGIEGLEQPANPSNR